MDLSLVQNLLIILAAGTVVGVICRRLGVSILIGYLLVGTLLGVANKLLEQSGLHLIDSHSHEVQHLAEAGVFLLLFSIGLEFSLDELARLSRWMLIGGSVQMTLVAAPVALFLWQVVEFSVPAAILIALALAFSSTVLVFKALAEWGQVDSEAGRRAIGVLLFQDVALVPLLLFIPLLTPGGEAAGWQDYARMLGSSLLVVGAVWLLRFLVRRFLVPLMARLRSPELVVLFALTILGGVTYGVYTLGLPAALGAFAAGLIFSDNRLTGQVDALLLPFRESFAAVFFVSLGLIIDPAIFITQTFGLLGALSAILVLKTVAASIALKLTGLRWKSALGMGLGLSQVGEFALVLASVALNAGPAGQTLISQGAYETIVAVALGTFLLTPLLLRLGMRWIEPSAAGEGDAHHEQIAIESMPEAIVIGMGPVGSQVASRLELTGIDVCLIDLSPTNLYRFAQQGFRTVAGDASDTAVLMRAEAERAKLIVVCVPDDRAALRVVRSIRDLNSTCQVLVRCRFVANMAPLRKAGANAVVSEEAEASEAILRLLANPPERPLPREESVSAAGG